MQPHGIVRGVGEPQRAADALQLLHGDLEHVAEKAVDVGLVGEHFQRLDEHPGLAMRQCLGTTMLFDLRGERAVGLLQGREALAQAIDDRIGTAARAAVERGATGGASNLRQRDLRRPRITPRRGCVR